MPELYDCVECDMLSLIIETNDVGLIYWKNVEQLNGDFINEDNNTINTIQSSYPKMPKTVVKISVFSASAVPFLINSACSFLKAS